MGTAKKRPKDMGVPLRPGEHRLFTFRKADLPELFVPQVSPKGSHAKRLALDPRRPRP